MSSIWSFYRIIIFKICSWIEFYSKCVINIFITQTSSSCTYSFSSYSLKNKSKTLPTTILGFFFRTFKFDSFCFMFLTAVFINEVFFTFFETIIFIAYILWSLVLFCNFGFFYPLFYDFGYLASSITKVHLEFCNKTIFNIDSLIIPCSTNSIIWSFLC